MCMHGSLQQPCKQNLCVLLQKVRLARQNFKERTASLRELQLMASMHHRNVLAFREAWVESGCVVCIVVELCESGDLATQLKLRVNSQQLFLEVGVRMGIALCMEYGTLRTPQPTVCRCCTGGKHAIPGVGVIHFHNGCSVVQEHLHEMAVQLASALEYIHKNEIAHRDIKSSNIFITGVRGRKCMMQVSDQQPVQAQLSTS